MRYIQDPTTLELVPADQYQRPRKEGAYIMSDIAPYQSIITGETITSRSKHREHLKQHNCIEVGSEKPSFMKE